MQSCYHLPRRDTRNSEVCLPDHLQTVLSEGINLIGEEDVYAIRKTDPLTRDEVPYEHRDNYSMMHDCTRSERGYVN